MLTVRSLLSIAQCWPWPCLYISCCLRAENWLGWAQLAQWITGPVNHQTLAIKSMQKHALIKYSHHLLYIFYIYSVFHAVFIWFDLTGKCGIYVNNHCFCWQRMKCLTGALKARNRYNWFWYQVRKETSLFVTGGFVDKGAVNQSLCIDQLHAT